MNKTKSVSKFLEELIVKGQYHFMLAEVAKELSMKQNSLSVSLSRLAKKKKIQMIRKGFGIITGFTSGTLHPSFFIDPMMKYSGARYYVGLLSAAVYSGASHQAVMNYTIVTDKVMKPICLDGLTIEFVTKNNFDEIEEIEKVSGIGGYYQISTPELTAIDLIRFQRKSGHLNNIATILEDLLDVIDLEKLELICSKRSTPTSVLQRLGYLFDEVLNKQEAAMHLHKTLRGRRVPRTLLSLSNKEDRKRMFEFSFNEKWKIFENVIVEPD